MKETDVARSQEFLDYAILNEDPTEVMFANLKVGNEELDRWRRKRKFRRGFSRMLGTHRARVQLAISQAALEAANVLLAHAKGEPGAKELDPARLTSLKKVIDVTLKLAPDEPEPKAKPPKLPALVHDDVPSEEAAELRQSLKP